MTERRHPVELDGQYRALREEAGCVDRSRARRQGDRAPRPPSTSRASSPTTSRRSSRARAATRRCSTARATCRPTCGCSCVWTPASSGSTSSPAGPELLLKHLAHLQRSGASVEIADVGDELGDHVADRPRAPSALAGVEGLGPEHAQRYRDCEGVEVLAVATDLGLDLITRSGAGRGRCAGLAGAAPSAVEATGARPRSSASSRAGRASASRWTRRRCRPRRGSSSARSTSRRAATSARSPSRGCTTAGKPNRRLRGLRLERPGGARRRRCALGETRGRDRRHSVHLPRARPDRPRGRAPRGRARRDARGRRGRQSRPRSSSSRSRPPSRRSIPPVRLDSPRMSEEGQSSARTAPSAWRP